MSVCKIIERENAREREKDREEWSKRTCVSDEKKKKKISEGENSHAKIIHPGINVRWSARRTRENTYRSVHKRENHTLAVFRSPSDKDES